MSLNPDARYPSFEEWIDSKNVQFFDSKSFNLIQEAFNFKDAQVNELLEALKDLTYEVEHTYAWQEMNENKIEQAKVAIAKSSKDNT